MAENPELASTGPDTMVPVPFPGERLLCTRRGMKIEIKGIRGRTWKAKGELFLSNVRMVFVSKAADADGLRAVDLPLVYVRSDRFNQPIFGCNNLSGECWPVCDDGGPSGSLPPLPYKLYFYEGGVGTFLPLYFTFITAAREMDRNQRQSGQHTQQPDVQSHMSQAFVDPDDPTKIYLTAPISQTTDHAPQYAKNFGQDEKYQPLV